MPGPNEVSEEDKVALVREVLPRTLRSLFLLRITLCALAVCLALTKLLLSPSVAAFYRDIFPDAAKELEAWILMLNMVISGLLAVTLSLVIATFLIQARLRAHALDQEIANG